MVVHERSMRSCFQSRPPPESAAAGIAWINSVGNLGGFAGPYIVGYLSKRTNSFIGGVLYLSLSGFLAAGLVLSLRAARSKQGLAAVTT